MRPEVDSDAGWVGALTATTRTEAEAALEEARRQRRLYAHLARAHRSEGRDSYVEFDAPLELHAMVRLARPSHVAEVGVASGVSSAYLLHGLRMNGTGRLHSIDRPAHPSRTLGVPRAVKASWSLPPGRSSGWAIPPSLRKGWDLRLGDKADLVPLLAEQVPTVELFLYDVPHEESDTFRELLDLDPRIPPGGIVIVDHGPGGGLCSALRRWAARRGTVPIGRRDLGAYAARAITAPGPRELRGGRSGPS